MSMMSWVDIVDIRMSMMSRVDGVDGTLLSSNVDTSSLAGDTNIRSSSGARPSPSLRS
jgi:hypothetical protein